MTNQPATLNRAPRLGDIVYATPRGVAKFEVVELDELYGEYVRIAPLDPEDPREAFWHSLTHIRVVA